MNTRAAIAAAIAVLLAPPLALGLIMVGAVTAVSGAQDAGDEPSPAALADIPDDYLQLYLEAGEAYGIDWAILAGIGKVECDHGRSQLAGCNPPGTINAAGARGPMQFLGSTWRNTAGQFDLDVAGPPIAEGQENRGYATDANADGTADPWQPADAIHAAARLLRRNGAPGNYRDALWAYNHSTAYADDVLYYADTYRTASEEPLAGGPVELATIRGITVHVSLAADLEDLLDAAAADGLTLTGGGYRSTAQQIELRKAHCGTSHYAIYEAPAGACTPPTARPGTSMHERGLAIDFNNCSTRTSQCWQWLNTHAAEFGLYNLDTEPWHWSRTGG